MGVDGDNETNKAGDGPPREMGRLYPKKQYQIMQYKRLAARPRRRLRAMRRAQKNKPDQLSNHDNPNKPMSVYW